MSSSRRVTDFDCPDLTALTLGNRKQTSACRNAGLSQVFEENTEVKLVLYHTSILGDEPLGQVSPIHADGRVASTCHSRGRSLWPP